ncbi:RNA-guided endonuclease InsQ/TnpB family protein [Synechocystis sp. PCC 7509]|uniref:RNA-guided endonuclease InsQ/TnpB family protein n=1 Tax=Synechocystis sp. PCC 7509 TaxID=927677 RepID=UPI000490E5B0|nr:RNA-guided endonuclease TnpB family protein [Synechocystis sp. PCC 7509]
MLTLTYRFRIYPQAAQQQELIEWMDICRNAYNYGLRQIKDWCNSRKCLVDRCSIHHEYILGADLPFPNEAVQHSALPGAKKEFPRLALVPSQVLQQTIKQLHRSWEGFQKLGHGFSRFKKYGQFKSLLFPQFKTSPIVGTNLSCKGSRKAQPPTNFALLLPKLGQVKVNLHRPIPDGFIVKQVRILKKADRWYASISLQCDVNVPDPIPHGYPIGVDIGLEKFLATSDGVLVKPPKFFKSLQSKLKLLQRRLSRKQKRKVCGAGFLARSFPRERSKNYEKARIKVALVHHQIDNTRKDFHFKQAHALCDAGDMVFMEDLDYTVMAKGMFGKHMLDGGFGAFRTIVKYVCWKRDKFFGVVNARGTSQECPECGATVKKDLSVRVHSCPECGFTTDRDVASGLVIRNRGIELVSTVGQTGIEIAYADGLPGAGENQSRSKSKTRKGKTRKSKL